jgi:CheY-like chemotaxis protein
MAEAYTGLIALLITDVIMPGMNGRELANRLNAFCPGIKCLFMSGYTADIIAPRGILEKAVISSKNLFPNVIWPLNSERRLMNHSIQDKGSRTAW